MPDAWKIWRSGPGEPAWNMAADETLLETVAQAGGTPILRFYSWTEPAATFGYFQKWNDVSAWTPLRPLIRRPTGGGLVPHDRDWTYSLAVPPAHPWYELRAEESYRRMHDWVHRAFARLKISATLAAQPIAGAGQCFAGAEKFDVLLENRKIAGAAQRRNRHGLLIQGSVQPPVTTPSRAAWEQALLAEATHLWKTQWMSWKPDQDLHASMARLAVEKYALNNYNARR